MALDMFLTLNGIQGESEDADFKGAIDVLAWSWGASNTGTLQVKGGKGAPSFQDLSLTKWIDRSSEDLLRLVATGAPVSDGELVVRKASGDSKPVNFLTIKFKPVIVTSVSTGGSGGEDRLTENISLNFETYEVTYIPILDDGGAGKSEIFAWDILAGEDITGSF